MLEGGWTDWRTHCSWVTLRRQVDELPGVGRGEMLRERNRGGVPKELRQMSRWEEIQSDDQNLKLWIRRHPCCFKHLLQSLHQLRRSLQVRTNLISEKHRVHKSNKFNHISLEITSIFTRTYPDHAQVNEWCRKACGKCWKDQRKKTSTFVCNLFE